MKEILKRIYKDLFHYRWGILLFLVYYGVVRYFFHGFCPMVIGTGFPCPACGMTRAVYFTLTGQFIRAFYMQPLVFLWVAFGIYVFYYRYIVGKNPRKWKLIVVSLLILLVVVYIFRMITMFPGYPPISYTHNNILEKYIPIYEEILHYMFEI